MVRLYSPLTVFTKTEPPAPLNPSQNQGFWAKLGWNITNAAVLGDAL